MWGHSYMLIVRTLRFVDTNNGTSFRWCWKENFVKYQKVSKYHTFKLMITPSSTNLFIPFWQASQVLSGRFIVKRNLANWSFHLVKYGNLTKTVFIFSRYTPVGRNFSKIVLFKEGWSDIWWKKYFSFFKLSI